MRSLHLFAIVLVIIGGLNWGLIGFTDYNLINALFGPFRRVEQIFNILVGISAFYVGVTHMGDCNVCQPKKVE